MFKMDLEKAEEAEIKLLISVGSLKNQENSRKTSASLTMLKPLSMWITTNCGKFFEMGIPDHLTCLLRNLYAGQEATIRTGHGITDWFTFGKGQRREETPVLLATSQSPPHWSPSRLSDVCTITP